jgi:hypothetical protein
MWLPESQKWLLNFFRGFKNYFSQKELEKWLFAKKQRHLDVFNTERLI